MWQSIALNTLTPASHSGRQEAGGQVARAIRWGLARVSHPLSEHSCRAPEAKLWPRHHIRWLSHMARGRIGKKAAQSGKVLAHVQVELQIGRDNTLKGWKIWG